jgi:hypothetical protein
MGTGYSKRLIPGMISARFDDDIVELALDAIKRMVDETEYPVSASYTPDHVIDDGWRPQPGSCHSNVATLVFRQSCYHHVSGHLIFRPALTGGQDWIVAAHSVAGYGPRELYEITPPAQTGIPFVRYKGTDEQLQRFREAYEVKLSRRRVEDYLAAH